MYEAHLCCETSLLLCWCWTLLCAIAAKASTRGKVQASFRVMYVTALSQAIVRLILCCKFLCCPLYLLLCLAAGCAQ